MKICSANCSVVVFVCQKGSAEIERLRNTDSFLYQRGGQPFEQVGRILGVKVLGTQKKLALITLFDQ